MRIYRVSPCPPEAWEQLAEANEEVNCFMGGDREQVIVIPSYKGEDLDFDPNPHAETISLAEAIQLIKEV